MTLNEFIRLNNINPADAVVVRKDFIGLLDHYLIYLGVDSLGNHKFIANYSKGVRILSNQDLRKFLAYLSPRKIKKFRGNETQRRAAIQRALSQLNRDNYHLILNNCEHYSNYVMHNKNYSGQTQALGVGLATAGLLAAATNKDEPAIRNSGFILAGLGLLTLLLNND